MLAVANTINEIIYFLLIGTSPGGFGRCCYSLGGILGNVSI